MRKELNPEVRQLLQAVCKAALPVFDRLLRHDPLSETHATRCAVAASPSQPSLEYLFAVLRKEALYCLLCPPSQRERRGDGWGEVGRASEGDPTLGLLGDMPLVLHAAPLLEFFVEGLFNWKFQ